MRMAAAGRIVGPSSLLHPRAATLVWLSLFTASLPATAEIPPSGLYAVRGGSSVVACGGFAPRCEAWALDGTLEIAVALPEEQAEDGAAIVQIVGTDLFLTPAGGSRSEFPAPQDLPLVGLFGEIGARGAELVAENELGQKAAVRIVGLERDLSDHLVESIALTGTYDQGCCDRFVLELGNVVLDPVPDARTMRLDGDRVDRFELLVLWSDGESESALATPVRDDEGSGRFWFFTLDNPEIFVKVLPVCFAPFDRIWVFATGLTDLAANLVIRDRLGDDQRVYGNSGPGEPFPVVLDTNAFSCLDASADG